MKYIINIIKKCISGAIEFEKAANEMAKLESNSLISNKKSFYMKNDKRKYHIVIILNDKQENQIIYKFFGIHKRYWHYEIESLYSFNSRVHCGLYSFKKIKRGKK